MVVAGAVHSNHRHTMAINANPRRVQQDKKKLHMHRHDPYSDLDDEEFSSSSESDWSHDEGTSIPAEFTDFEQPLKGLYTRTAASKTTTTIPKLDGLAIFQASVNRAKANAKALKSSTKLGNSCASLDNLLHDEEEKEKVATKKRLSPFHKSSSANCIVQSRSYTCKSTANESWGTGGKSEGGKQLVSPQQILEKLLQAQGMKYNSLSAKDMPKGFFLEMKAENYAGYTPEVARAARDGDLQTLSEHILMGKTVQCCNKFDESVVHIICRRGNDQLLRYLLTATDLSIQICCVQGRTPLHDAAWTHKPNFALVKLLLEVCPDLLYIKDERGFTPLSYVSRAVWIDWCEFLKNNKDILTPKKLQL